MLLNIVLLLVGFVLLIKGADWFVGGSSNIAKALKIPSLIIGLTLVSIGTSMPEASVSIQSAIKGNVGISIGNVVGSNIFNTLLILGVSASFIPLIIQKDMKKFDIPIMVLVYGILILFTFVITPNVISRLEAIILFALFIGYIVFLVMRAKKSKNGIEENLEKKEEKLQPMWLSIVLTIIGLAGIIFGGTLTVNSAEKIALELGMSQSLVGLTIVAIGTSLPELVTSIVAAIKKENDIAVGNVVGSNMFNVIFILGASGIINPLVINPVVATGTLIDMLVMIGSGVILMAIALFGKKLNRVEGIAFLTLYVAYMAYIIVRG